MVDKQPKSPDRPPVGRYYAEYVEVSTDKLATNEALRKALGERLRVGWKLVNFTVDRSGGVAELVWDTCGFRIGDEMEAAKRCPRCSSDEVLPIAYGMPSPELVEECAAGRVKLGGCAVWPESPDWYCARCGHEWQEAPPAA